MSLLLGGDRRKFGKSSSFSFALGELIQEDGFSIVLEDGSGNLATERLLLVPRELLLEDGFNLDLENGAGILVLEL